MLFPITIKEFDLEPAIVIKQHITGLHFNVYGEIEFTCIFSVGFQVCDMNQVYTR